jgi:hypothetical protein
MGYPPQGNNVNVPGQVAGDILYFNGTTGKWERTAALKITASGVATPQDQSVFGLLLGRYSAGFAGAAIKFVDTTGGANHPTFLTFQSNDGVDRFLIHNDSIIQFGAYTAGAATDSTGYITVKDLLGNTRKLMVQA